jgi:hypothetical protein
LGAVIPLKLKSREDVENPWIEDEAELLATLKSLGGAARAARRPLLLELSAKNKNTLSLVVGAPWTVVIFGGHRRKPRYCHSLGDPDAAGARPTCLDWEEAVD